MANPKDEMIRATLTESMARVIKRRRYDERQVVQILRATPDKARAIVTGQLDGFSTDEIRKMIDVLD
jgi:predicted XRE-type DNA-binding protein